jgi:hypothetical protein
MPRKKVTGELIEIERLTISSEGGRWKRAKGYLAGGLPYCKSGLEGRVRKHSSAVRLALTLPARTATRSASLRTGVKEVMAMFVEGHVGVNGAPPPPVPSGADRSAAPRQSSA